MYVSAEFLYFAGSVEPGQDASAEGDRIAVLRHDRKHHPSRNESCRRPALLVNARPRVAQHIGGQPQLAAHRIPVVGRPAQLELPGDVAGQAATAQVVAPPRVVAGQQSLVIPLDGLAHRLDQPLAALPVLALAARGVAQLNAGLGGQLLDGVDEVDVFDLLHEREDVAGARSRSTCSGRSLRGR